MLSTNKTVGSVTSDVNKNKTEIVKEDNTPVQEPVQEKLGENEEQKIMSTMRFDVEQAKTDIPKLSENIMTGQPKMYVKYDNATKRFNIIDNSNKFIGSLTTNDIIKYFTKIYDPNNKFLENISNANFTLIEDLIGKIDDKTHVIMLKDFNTSPFMGDLEMIMQLNNDLQKFETDSLEKELNFVNEKVKEKIKASFYKYVISMIEYTISLISSLSNVMIGDNKKHPNMRSNLILYSANLIHRLSKYTELQLKLILEKNKKITKHIELSNRLRELVNKRLEKYTKLLEERNTIAREKQLVNNVITQMGGSEIVLGPEEQEDMLSDTSEMLSDNNEESDNEKESEKTSSSADHSAIYDM